MKLNGFHLFLILLGSLILCCSLGGPVVEGLGSMSRSVKATTYTGPQGKNATVVQGQDGTTVAKGPNNNVVSNTSYTSPQSNVTATSYSAPQADVTATSYTGPAGNTVYGATGPQGNTAVGITANQIPAGDEDLYILKSEVVPPVCPACPTISACPRQEPCPPCPPCARCPEPAFECKKVPNYTTNDDRYLPRPVLADFSQFGM